MRAKVKKLKQLYQKVQHMLEEQERIYQISKDGFQENAYDYDQDKYAMVKTNIMNRILKYCDAQMIGKTFGRTSERTWRRRSKKSRKRINRNAFAIEAKTENLGQVLEFIRGQLEKQDCPVRILGQIEIAAEEIFVNISRYAYETGVGDAGIRVEVEQDPLRVAITFMDHGVPYDPLQKEDPDTALSAEDRQIGGLGS